MPNPDDSVLVAAVKEFRKLQTLANRLEQARQRKESPPTFRATERELERLTDRSNALLEFIYRAPAAGLIGAVVKLRMLTDPAWGLIDDSSDEIEALRDVLRSVEREMKARRYGR